MIHITRTKKGQFMVTNTGKNGEILKTSELLKSKQSAWKNVKADMDANCGREDWNLLVQDGAKKTPEVVRFYSSGSKLETAYKLVTIKAKKK